MRGGRFSSLTSRKSLSVEDEVDLWALKQKRTRVPGRLVHGLALAASSASRKEASLAPVVIPV